MGIEFFGEYLQLLYPDEPEKTKFFTQMTVSNQYPVVRTQQCKRLHQSDGGFIGFIGILHLCQVKICQGKLQFGEVAACPLTVDITVKACSFGQQRSEERRVVIECRIRLATHQ